MFNNVAKKRENKLKVILRYAYIPASLIEKVKWSVPSTYRLCIILSHIFKPMSILVRETILFKDSKCGRRLISDTIWQRIDYC